MKKIKISLPVDTIVSHLQFRVTLLLDSVVLNTLVTNLAAEMNSDITPASQFNSFNSIPANFK